MIKIKTPEQIKNMEIGGRIASEAMGKVINAAKPGAKLSELNKIADDYIVENGAFPSFKMVDDYDYATCINVNEGIVHGIPNNYKIKSGDIVSIDLGAFYGGVHTDMSYTIEIETNKEGAFLKAGKLALEAAVNECVEGNRIGDISSAMQKKVESAGFTVSRELVGHGLGEELHEDPMVPGYGNRKEGPVIREGMVLAIEVIYQKGNPRIALAKDGWTLMTADRSLSGLFEQTVAVVGGKPQIITPFTF